MTTEEILSEPKLQQNDEQPATRSRRTRRQTPQSMVELIVAGHVCSKKNQLKLTRSGHGYYDAQTRANIDGITTQLRAQWRDRDLPRPPLAHPAIAVIFYVTTTNSDRDNKWTTLQDCLVDAGVLKGDSIEDLNSYILLGHAIKTEHTAGARIWLEPTGNFGRLYRYITNQNLDDYEIVQLHGDVARNRRFKKI